LGPSDYRAEKTNQHTEGIMDQVSEIGERARTMAGELADAVTERPYTTLTIAAGTAFAVGALWMIGRQRPQTRMEALQSYLNELPDLRSRIPRPAWDELFRRWWR
jgi:hypothetical protein